MIYGIRATFRITSVLVFAAICVQAETIDALSTSSQGEAYNLQDNFVGSNFLGGFNWETFDDPSGSYVNYVDQDTAVHKNLTYTSDEKFVIRADHTNVVQPGSRGRDSIRITSHKSYTDSILVLDLQHMPSGCGQWPAFWTFDPSNWPNGGEVDIMEGINKMTSNFASLHSSDGCTMPPTRAQKGTSPYNDCSVTARHNTGCQTKFTDNTFGDALNSGSGGFFAVTRSDNKGIAIYFWLRNDPTIPTEIRFGSQTLSPSEQWGEPQALFPTDNCDFSSHFTAHNIVINLSICGPWAGKAFSRAGCGDSCNDYATNNPEGFVNAYWEINALRVYTP